MAEVLRRELGPQTAEQRAALVDALLERIAARRTRHRRPRALQAVRSAQGSSADRFWTRPQIAAATYRRRYPYLRSRLQFSASLEPRLLQTVPADELARLRQEVGTELVDPARWGTTSRLSSAGARPHRRGRQDQPGAQAEPGGRAGWRQGVE